MLTIVTGCSQNHFWPEIQFLRSLFESQQPEFQCYFYDLGISPKHKEFLVNKFPKVVIRSFDYSKYPSYFNIHMNAGQYAWKPVILEQVMNEILEKSPSEPGYLVWCDAGNKITGNLKHLEQVLSKAGLYTPESQGAVQNWTHFQTLQYFRLHKNHPILRMPMRAGGYIGFDLTREEIRGFVRCFSICAQTEHCIAPRGSHRGNHRQDQSVLSILYYFYRQQYPFQSTGHPVQMAFWQDSSAIVYKLDE